MNSTSFGDAKSPQRYFHSFGAIEPSPRDVHTTYYIHKLTSLYTIILYRTSLMGQYLTSLHVKQFSLFFFFDSLLLLSCSFFPFHLYFIVSLTMGSHEAETSQRGFEIHAALDGPRLDRGPKQKRVSSSIRYLNNTLEAVELSPILCVCNIIAS